MTGLGSVVVVIATLAPIVIESDFDAVWGVGVVVSVTWIVTVEVPAVVGVPEMAPVDARVRPAGSEPDVMAHA